VRTTAVAVPSPRASSEAVVRCAHASDVLVILPTFNEERSVGRVIDEVRRCLPDVDVLVVDDGCTDDSAAVARAHGALVLQLPYNLGVGGAMRAGYSYAWRRRYRAVVQVDADGQHDPRDVPALLAALADADVVIGARFAGEGDYGVRGPRRWAMRALASSVSRRAGTPLTDVTSGFRACNADAIALFRRNYPAEYLGDTVGALLIAQRAGLRLRQLPVAMRAREVGLPSQSALRASLHLVRTLLAMAVDGVRTGQVAVVQPPRAAIDTAG